MALNTWHMAKSDNKLSFTAEIKQVNSRKTASLDIEYKIVLVSNDPALMALGMVPADATVKVVVEPNK